MSRPHNKDAEGIPIYDGRGKLTSKDMEGSRHYRDNVKVLATDDAGNVIEKMPIGKHLLWEGVAYVSLLKGDGAAFPLTHVPANPSKSIPEYDVADMHGVKVHLRDGIKPDEYGMLKGRVQISVRIVQPRDAREQPLNKLCHYLSVNVFPSDEEPSACLLAKKVKGGQDRLGCLKHWGPDFNRSHVFVCALSENPADHTKVVAEQRWVDLIKEWDELVRNRVALSEVMNSLLANINNLEMRMSIETELHNVMDEFRGLFLDNIEPNESVHQEQKFAAAKQWIKHMERVEEESELCGWLDEIEDKTLNENLDVEIHDIMQELALLFRKATNIDQATWDKAIEAVIP